MNALVELLRPPTHHLPLHRGAVTRVVQRGHLDARMHVLFVLDEGTPPKPFAPLIQFFREEGPCMRLSRQREMVWAVGLLLDFLAAYEQDINSVATDALLAFAHAVRRGTAPGSALANAGLLWPERSHDRAARCLMLVSEFTDWLSNRTGRLPPNAWQKASDAERLVLMRRVERRSMNALLGHIAMQASATAPSRVRTVSIGGKRNGAIDRTVYAFDEKDFIRLVRHGFSRRGMPVGAALHKRVRLRDLMITLLLHGGGLRDSEPFHLFVGDVDIDPEHPGIARVRVYHPEDGAAPVEGHRRWRDRAHYLQERWRMEPRTRVSGRYRAGWKDLALTDARHQFAEVFWFPDDWGRAFLNLYRAYLKVRPRSNHPFLFVSEREACRGEPYTIAAFEQAHARAVRRIGLDPTKHLGTTPHGHRHAYGRAMTRAKLDRLTRQRGLHHRSPNSQDVYTAPDAAAVTAEMSAASHRLRGDHQTFLNDLGIDDDD